MNNIIKIMALTFIFGCSTYSSEKLSEDGCVSYFSSAKIKDDKSQLDLYTKVESCSSFLNKNEGLVKSVVESYRQLFKVNRAHNHLEPFMPYYLKNKEKVNQLILKIEDKEERETFTERLNIASREFLEGND